MLAVEFISKVIAYIILAFIGILVYPPYLVAELLVRICREILFIFKLPNLSTIWITVKTFLTEMGIKD